MTNNITYELPLNERIRTFLKLEDLFKQMSYFAAREDQPSNRAELHCFLNILSIASRSDLKTEISKEIDRHLKSLSSFTKNPNVDNQKLNETIERLYGLSHEITNSHGKIDQKAHSVELLKALSQRNNIAGGSCDFDIPAYHFWLNQPIERRRQQINDWAANLVPIKHSIALLLNIVRHSAAAEAEVAFNGFYQKSLSNHQNVQLIRISLAETSPYFAEISGGKHRFTLRFMQAKETERAIQADLDIKFTLYLCQI